MSRVTVTKTINAPLEFVFHTVAEIENFSKAIPHIVNVEFLSENKTGIGAKFRETRIMMGKEASTVLEVTEYSENERIRLVSDESGTIWDSLFTVRMTVDGATELTLVMEAKPYKTMARILNPFTAFMVRKGVVSDMDAVKQYCETQ